MLGGLTNKAEYNGVVFHSHVDGQVGSIAD